MYSRILLIRLSALGDVALATPALRALRAHFPQARIDWLVEAPYADVLSASPHLSSLVPYDKRGEHKGAAGLVRLRNQLARQHYDLVIDLQNKPKTAALARSLGAKRVVSFTKRTKLEALRAVVGLERPRQGDHAVDLFVTALACLGVQAHGSALEVVVPERGRQPEGLPTPGPGPAWVGLAPGARWATKRWLPERFAEVGNALAAQGHPVLLVGGPGDRADIEAVRARLKVPPVGETTDLPVAGLLGALQRLGVLIAGDSGPVHLADALGTPVVVLFGPTAPGRWAPRSSTCRVVYQELVCSPCSNHGSARCPIGTHACMTEISAAEVIAAARELLTRQRSGPVGPAPVEAQGA